MPPRPTPKIIQLPPSRNDECINALKQPECLDDMSDFLALRPGCYFWLGARNEAKGIAGRHHDPGFVIDEAAFCTDEFTPTVGWFTAAAGMKTLSVEVGTTPVSQFPAVDQSVLTSPSQTMSVPGGTAEASI